MDRIYWLFFVLCLIGQTLEIKAQSRGYYVDCQHGNDQNVGTRTKPWKTIDKLNTLSLKIGDAIYLKGGQTFTGTLQVRSSGTKAQPILLTSYGAGKATIDAGNKAALLIQNSRFVIVRHLNVRGSGRKSGNRSNGVAVSGSQQIVVDDIDASGFQKSGVLIDSSSQVRVTRVKAHDNGFAGILVSGRRAKADCQYIYIGHCRAENNPGDPTVLDNHSGNGILVGNCAHVLIEYCSATNNGWDMPRKGNGPVGIWAYEADSVVIQHCLSYRNKTSAGSADGGGFDLDGGVTNSTIQYCLSYENHGSGFGIFQYAGASPWSNNTIRYNISENDGLASSKAGIYIWNSSQDADQFTNCYVYNNVVYNDRGAAISYSKENEHKGFRFYNNIFVSKDHLIIGQDLGNDVFEANNWFSLIGGFKMKEETNFRSWVSKTGKEQRNGKLVGLSINPKFARPGKTTLTSPTQLKSFSAYRVPATSPLRTNGLRLKIDAGIEPGLVDFIQKLAPKNGIGASF